MCEPEKVMTELEKVVKGLGCCMRENNINLCAICPYHDSGDTCFTCMRSAMRDALALLKEQERQLKEWEKYAPFLAAHGVLKEGEKDA